MKINCGEKMGVNDEGKDFVIEVEPKTIEAAVKLAKKKDELEGEENFIGGEEISVDTNLSLLSKVPDDPSIKPYWIASLRYEKFVSIYEYYHDYHHDDDRIQEGMMDDLKDYFEDAGLNFDDYTYDFSVSDEEFG